MKTEFETSVEAEITAWAAKLNIDISNAFFMQMATLMYWQSKLS
jgi:hypothetical protein